MARFLASIAILEQQTEFWWGTRFLLCLPAGGEVKGGGEFSL